MDDPNHIFSPSGFQTLDGIDDASGNESMRNVLTQFWPSSEYKYVVDTLGQ
jgi:hypothetical protein